MNPGNRMATWDNLGGIPMKQVLATMKLARSYGMGKERINALLVPLRKVK